MSDAFENLFSDRVVIKTNESRYLLRHDALEQILTLTVYAGPGCERAPAEAMYRLSKCLDQIRCGFGVQYRFEAHSDDFRGESGWFPLEDLRGLVEQAACNICYSSTFAATDNKTNESPGECYTESEGNAYFQVYFNTYN